MKIPILVLSAFALILFPACSPEPTSEVSDVSDAPTYESLRSASIFVVEQTVGVVAPNRVTALSAFKPGDLTFLAEEGGVQAGTVWAEYKSSGFDEQLQAIEAKETAYLEQIDIFGSLELEMELNTLEESLEEARRAQSLSRAFDGVSDSTVSALSPNASLPLSPDNLKTKIRLIERKIEELKKHGRSREQRNTLNDLKLKKDEVQARIDAQKLIIPFSGELQYSNAIEPGLRLNITAPQAVGTLIDYSRVFLRIEMNSEVTAKLTPDEISVVVPSLPGASPQFSHSKIEEVRSLMTRVHYFSFPKEEVARLKGLVGKTLSAQIAVETPEPVRVVSKSVLLRFGEGQSWKDRLRSMFPECSIAHEGTYELAIRRDPLPKSKDL